jgi:hypothetical protein
VLGSSRIPYINERIVFVFDKDSFSAGQFNNAIKKARERYPGCVVAWSNESFELWLCLHFDYIDSALTRNDYNEKLTQIFKEKGIYGKRENYEKNGKNDDCIYDKIINSGGSIDKAIKYAEKLIEDKELHNPAKANPATMVFEIVVALLNEAGQI